MDLCCEKNHLHAYLHPMKDCLKFCRQKYPSSTKINVPKKYQFLLRNEDFPVSIESSATAASSPNGTDGANGNKHQANKKHEY